MASIQFKKEINQRTFQLFKTLLNSGLAKNNTEIARLMRQPLQIISKLFSGERILTMEQCSMLAKNANVNVDWVVTGRGEMFMNKKISSYHTDNMDPIKIATSYQNDSNKNLECFRNAILQIRGEIETLKSYINTSASSPMIFNK
ncbi:MAG: hypothetical protein ACMUEL_01405 [Flavobacteriales bacterium Tduv]